MPRTLEAIARDTAGRVVVLVVDEGVVIIASVQAGTDGGKVRHQPLAGRSKRKGFKRLVALAVIDAAR
jgi:hypothetical protein